MYLGRPQGGGARRWFVLLSSALVAAGCGRESERTAAQPEASAGTGGAATTTVVAGAGGAGGSGGAVPEPSGPPYPVVLAHGFFGFEDFAGLDFVNYFYGVRQYLAERSVEVETPAVDPFNYSDVRGAQLAEQVSVILRRTGAAKVNLIGHSQGGLDARVVAHDHPEWVASVVTVSTPHRGSVLADIALELIVDPHLDAVLDFFVHATGQSVWDGAGEESSLAASAHQLATAEAEHFNARYPDAPGVRYWSVAGRSNLHHGGGPCVGTMPPLVTEWSGTLDPIDPLMAVTAAILEGPGLIPEPNDGLVTVASSRWGEFWGCVPADHFDEMGQILGDDPGMGNAWDHRAFYLALIEAIRAEGL